MKKLLSIITILLVISLGACSPKANDDLENRVETLEAQVEVLQDFYENVVKVEGLNGQVDYFVNEDNKNYYLSASYLETMIQLADKTEKDYLDKTKFPDYIWDNDGEYISIEDLDTMLAEKYFGEVNGTIFETGSQYHFIFNLDTNMSDEEFIVRLSMLIIELSNYDFYTIDSSELHIYVLLNDSPVEITIRMMLLIEDNFNLQPQLFWSELMDTTIKGITYNENELQSIYDGYVTNETFNGYVLPNYK